MWTWYMTTLLALMSIWPLEFETAVWCLKEKGIGTKSCRRNSETNETTAMILVKILRFSEEV